MSQTYEGRDGLQHTMTNIDLDKTLNTKISTSKLSKQELLKLEEQVKHDKMRSILCILALPAVSVQKDFARFTTVNDGQFIWLNNMVMDACMIDDMLRHHLWIAAWKNTIDSIHWDMDLSYEEIIKGKWKKYARKY